MFMQGNSIFGRVCKHIGIHRIILMLLYIVINLVLAQSVSIDYLSDGDYYNGIAQAMLNDSSTILQPGVRNHGEDIGLLLMPGFSYLMNLVYAVLGNSLSNFVGFLIVIGGISILLFYQILHKITSKSFAFFLASLLVLFVEIWRYNFSGMMESMSVSLVIFTLYFLQNFISKQSWQQLILFSLFAFVLVAINNRFILHIFLAYAALVIFYIRNKQQLFKVLAGGVLFLLLMLPWHIRQYQVYNEIVFFGPQRSQRIYDVDKQQDSVLSYEEAKQYLATPSVDRMDPEKWMHKFTPDKYNALLQAHQQNKRSYFTDRLLGFFELVRSDFRLGYGNRIDLPFPPNIYGPKQQLRLAFHLLVYGLGFLLMIPSIVYSFRRRDLLSAIAFLFFSAHVFIHAYIIYLPRYRLLIVPVLLLLSINGIQQLSEWNRYLRARLAKN